MKRKRMVSVFTTATEAGNYDDVPVMPAIVDPQVHLSRNWVDQPFFLICSKDTVLAQMTGEAELQLKGSSVNSFVMRPGDNVYVPAGTPHRVLPRSETIQLRYRPVRAGREGAAWYCPGCDRELRRVVWDTESTVSQQAWLDACEEFNADESARECSSCGVTHPRMDMSQFGSWKGVAAALTAERDKTSR